MKKPIEPNKPYKPSPPSKTIRVANRVMFSEYDNLQTILEKIPEGTNLSEVSFSYDVRTGYYDENDVIPHLVYYTTADNVYYKSAMSKYKDDLENYDKKLKQLKPKLDKYQKDKQEYDEWYAEQSKNRDIKQLDKLKKLVKSLEAKLQDKNVKV